MITSSGATNRAIWVLDPTAISMAVSTLFFIAKNTALMCSAALPRGVPEGGAEEASEPGSGMFGELLGSGATRLQRF